MKYFRIGDVVGGKNNNVFLFLLNKNPEAYEVDKIIVDEENEKVLDQLQERFIDNDGINLAGGYFDYIQRELVGLKSFDKIRLASNCNI